MSMTVIFSNAGDEDCKTLKNLWKDVEDVTVIELKANKSNSKEKIINAIKNEKDLLVFCGHGNPSGLFNPSWKDCWNYAFKDEDVEHIRAKQVLAIWCYAKDFWEHHTGKGFNILTSSMYISNSGEAYVNGFPNIPQNYVNDTNNATFQEMNRYILDGLHARDWKDKLMETLDVDNKIDGFNRNGMTYFGD